MRLLLCGILLILMGCQTNPYGDRPKELVYKTRAFEDTVRWGALEKMVFFVKREGDGKPVPIQSGLDNIRVTGYEASALTKVTENRWTQTAVIHYVLTDRQIVRQLVDPQIWVSDDQGKSWYRENPLPQFR